MGNLGVFNLVFVLHDRIFFLSEAKTYIILAIFRLFYSILHGAYVLLLLCHSHFIPKVSHQPHILFQVAAVEAHVARKETRHFVNRQVFICDLQVLIVKHVPSSEAVEKDRVHDVLLEIPVALHPGLQLLKILFTYLEFTRGIF